MQTNISKRLNAAASFVREGSYIADIGTDHAYLPIYLAKTGKIRGGVASDINEGPYLCAKKNIAAEGLSRILTAYHTAGLDGIEVFDPTDIMICGMGGELIAKIISDAPWVKNESIRLVLQPMTHPEILRKFLLDEGFDIKDERIIHEDKLYVVLCAEYVGKSESCTYTEAELLLGKKNIEKASNELFMLIDWQISVQQRIADAKLLGGAGATEEQRIIKLLEDVKNDCKRAL